MAARGDTHAAIADHFGRCERTIRYWLAEAQRRRLVAFRGQTPERLLAASETKLLALQAVLMQRLTAATARQGDGADGAAVPEPIDNRGIAALVREVRGLEIDRYRLREIAGFFNDVRWHHPPGDEHDDPAVRGADLLKEMILETFAPEGRPNSLRALPKPTTDEDDEDDPIL
jgi:transposase-like protein